jgi:hypothetical protein
MRLRGARAASRAARARLQALGGVDEGVREVEADHGVEGARHLEGGAADGAADVQRAPRRTVRARRRVLGHQLRAARGEARAVARPEVVGHQQLGLRRTARERERIRAPHVCSARRVRSARAAGAARGRTAPKWKSRYSSTALEDS